MAKTAAQKAFDAVQKFSDLPEDVQARIASEAIAASNDLGYCEEATNVLSEMGFDAGEKRVKVTLEVEIYAPPFAELGDRDEWHWSVNVEKQSNGYDVLEAYGLSQIKVLRVEDAK